MAVYFEGLEPVDRTPLNPYYDALRTAPSPARDGGVIEFAVPGRPRSTQGHDVWLVLGPDTRLEQWRKDLLRGLRIDMPIKEGFSYPGFSGAGPAALSTAYKLGQLYKSSGPPAKRSDAYMLSRLRCVVLMTDESGQAVGYALMSLSAQAPRELPAPSDRACYLDIEFEEAWLLGSLRSQGLGPLLAQAVVASAEHLFEAMCPSERLGPSRATVEVRYIDPSKGGGWSWLKTACDDAHTDLVTHRTQQRQRARGKHQ